MKKDLKKKIENKFKLEKYYVARLNGRALNLLIGGKDDDTDIRTTTGTGVGGSSVQCLTQNPPPNTNTP